LLYDYRLCAVDSLAGLWENWNKEGNDLNTFTIITTSANKLMEDIHDRMPVILDREGKYKWLDPDPKYTLVLKDMLVPYTSEEMEAYVISTYVNSPRNN